MHWQNTGAKTVLGLVKRVAGVITAFTLAVFINFLLDCSLLAVKELFVL